MIRRLGLLLGGTMLLWGASAYPAFLLQEETGLIFSGTALGLCLVPALATLVWAEWSFRRQPDVFLFVVLGGTGIRIFVVLGAAWALLENVPCFQQKGFLIWVALAYFFTLTLELIVLLCGRARPEPTKN